MLQGRIQRRGSDFAMEFPFLPADYMYSDGTEKWVYIFHNNLNLGLLAVGTVNL